ncbi:hypothetical protein BDW59DRAFT_166033 [Aspergillus cavernicola]|uniref:Uncharacterized protein n=1 Tax=Aspergillus cavernicola TaxID=176166 RepID=A0ABR4HP04_9EURO
MNTTTEPTSGELSSPPPHKTTTTIPQTTSTSLEHPQPEREIFEQLRTYQFSSDREFAQGLAIIFGHPETPASEEEISRNDDLVLQAKCYYFTRKEKPASPVNVAAYKAWLEARPISDGPAAQTPMTELREPKPSAKFLPLLPGDTVQQSNSTSQEPAYPTSFAHIVELITTGQSIPGIQQIPDTLLTGQGASSAKPKRRKPWEKEEPAEAS